VFPVASEKWYLRLQVGGPLYFLAKISDNGTTPEYVWRSIDFPAEADSTPENVTYRIYYHEYTREEPSIFGGFGSPCLPRITTPCTRKS
jgi:hypothetical protein